MKTLKAFDIFVSNNGKVSCKTIQATSEAQATAQVEGTITKVIDLGFVGEWKPETELVNILDLKAGMVVRFYGARFEILETEVIQIDGQDVMVAPSKYIDGEVVTGYFGPDQNWNFQGNRHVRHYIEIN